MVLQRSLSARRADLSSILVDAEGSFLAHVLDGHFELLVLLQGRGISTTQACSKWVGSWSREEDGRRLQST